MNPTNLAGVNSGNGKAIITVLVTPATALNFDGVDDIVDLGNVHNSLESLTISAWIYRTANNGFGYDEIWAKDNISSMSINNANNKLHVNFGNGNTWGNATESAQTIPLNEWVFVAATRDFTTGAVKIYINGEPDGSGSNNLTGFNLSLRGIGYKPGVPLQNGIFAGSIDEVRLWNRVLCEGELKNSMNAELTLPQTGLVSYYKFNHGNVGEDNAGVTTVADLVGGMDGTLSNFALTGASSNWVAGKVTGTAPAFVAPTVSFTTNNPLTQCSGSSVVFTATSAAGSTYQWTKDGTPINGATNNTYTATASGSYNVIVTQTGCTASATAQVVVIEDTTKPIVPVLADVTGQCSATVTAPTTTDNCAGTITGTTTDPLVYNTQGEFTITWTFNDGNGNSSTAQQKVVVKDTQKPGVVAFAAPSNLLANVSEAANFNLAYTLNIPNTADYNSPDDILYAVNNASSLQGKAITRIAYALELDNKWVWVSMDAFSQNVSELGIPTGATGFQQKVNNLNVFASSNAGVTTGTGIATGNVEIWSNCYATGNATNLPGANAGVYDFDDTRDGANCYGSFQVHNYGAKQTLLAYNRWSETVGGFSDVGIGNQGVGNPDWTFAFNANTYTTKKLHVFVQTDAGLFAKNATVFLDANGNASITAADVNAGVTDNCGIASVTVDKTSFTATNLGTNPITLTATDVNGNVNTATATVTVLDNTNPVFTSSQGNEIVALDAITGTASLKDYAALASATDNSGSVAITQSPAAGTALAKNVPVTVTLTATDASGNKGTQTFTVTATDQTKPVPNVNPLATITGECSATVIAPTATDNTAGTITATTTDPLTYTAQGSYTITWKYDDGSGNIETQTQTVVVKDVTAPVFATVASITKTNEVDKCGAIVNYDAPEKITFSQAFVEGQTSPHCDEWKAFQDQLLPSLNFSKLTIKGSLDQTGVSISDPALIAQIANALHTRTSTSVTENGRTWNVGFCGTDGNNQPAIELTASGSMCSCQNGYTVRPCIDVNFGNPNWGGAGSQTCNGPSQVLTVVFEISGGSPGGVTATDNCTSPVTITQTAGLASGSLFPVGTTTNTFEAKDAAGNITTTSFDVTVTDTQKPTVLTQNIIVALDANGTAVITPAQINNGSTDNCSIPSNGYSLDKTSFDCTNVGANTVTLTVTDVNGNSQTKTATVTIEDKNLPMAKAKNIAVQLDANGVATITPAMVDNGSADQCSPVTLALSTANFDCINLGENTVVLTATDNSGNVHTATAVVTVQDVIAPVAIAKNITVQLDATGKVSVAAAQVNNSSTDNCGIEMMTLSKTAFDCGNIGPNTVTLTVADKSGNMHAIDAIVTVEDRIAPVVLAKNFTAQLDATGKVVVTTADVDNGSSDACGIASMTLSKSDFDCSNVGANPVTITVTDNNNNVSTAVVTITVQDKVAPTAIAKNITAPLGANGTVSIMVADIDNGSSDACGIASMTLSKTTFDCTATGPNTVTLTVTDVNGNVSTADAIVTVVEEIAPVAIAKNITVELDANGEATVTAAQVNNNSTDNCGIGTLVLSKTDFNCSNVGENTVTLTITDKSGNTNSASAVITIVDKMAPVVTAQNITVQLDAAGNASITAAQVDNGSKDNCGIQSVTIDKANFSCENVGDNVVTLTVTDIHGNVSTGTATVKIEDKVAPVAVARNIKVQLDATGKVIIAAADLDNGSSDACGIASMTVSKTDFDCGHLGQNTVVLTVTDKNGNSATVEAIVTVEDKVAPVAVAKNLTVQLDATGKVAITAAQVDGGSTDNCTIATITVDKTDFTCANVGDNEVTITVTDQSGNTHTAKAIVTVEDKVGPVVLAQNLTIQLDANGAATITAADVNANSSDNCGIASMVLSKSVFDCSNVGANVVTFTVTDVNGNAATAQVIITVEDKTNPTITAPANVTVNVDPGKTTASNVALGTPVTADNCSATTFNNNGPAEYPTGTTTVTWTVTDASGNTATATQTVTVRPNAVSVAKPAMVEVKIRTTFAQVPKPATVEVTFTDGNKAQVPVTWQPGTYNGLVAGDYELTGILNVPSDKSNVDNVVAKWTVRVLPNQAPTDIKLSKATFQPSILPDQAIGTFTAVDVDDPIDNLPENQHRFDLITGAGSTDNDLFDIRDGKLYLLSNKGLSGRTTFSIRVLATDPYDNTFEKVFTITKEAYSKETVDLKIVNAFSPNGDGVNDTWTVPELRFYNSVEVQVFDRSGVRLFHTTNPEEGWNGRDTNGRVLVGPYLYIIHIKDINFVKRGTVTILKKQ
ncbi:HYR domain-containing protein [Nibribacter ruber]|uniref:HYR domain-containing protein n=1 Tax=Nibribacter ruber TaxID=2698458 RepID=UPI001E6033BB|nr:HYR domain-containing protein [Nibribacter ruber]